MAADDYRKLIQTSDPSAAILASGKNLDGTAWEGLRSNVYRWDTGTLSWVVWDGSVSGGGGGGGGAVTVADGADVTQGAIADAAVSTDVPGTLSAKLRGIVKLLASVITGGKVTVDGSSVTQPVSGAFFQATQPVSGPLTDVQLRASAVPVSGTFFQATQPISAAALPLPAGASTEATLATRLSESDFDTKTGSLTEAAPASDTASSGLNGRLQRIAQRITSLTAIVATEATLALVKAKTDNLDVLLSSRLKPADTLAAVTSITNVVHVDDNAGSLTVDGPLTDVQLRASAVPISGNVGVLGSVEVVNDVGNPLPVSATSLPLPTGAATEATLATRLSEADFDAKITATQPRSITSIVPGIGATNLGKAEDSVAADGDTGMANLGVRQDIPTTDTSAVGDYSWVKTDAQGRLWMNSDVLGALLNNQSNILQQILTELRVLNTLVVEGMNVRTDPDSLRSDPYYSPFVQ